MLHVELCSLQTTLNIKLLVQSTLALVLSPTTQFIIKMFSKPIIALAAALGLASLGQATTIPNGQYEVTNLADGGQSWQSATDSSAAPIVVPGSETSKTVVTRSAKFGKRGANCWNYNLDHTGTDVAAQGLRDWAGSGHDLIAGDTTNYHAEVYNGVQVYYCINARRSSGNLDTNDVNFALGQMDAHCPMYTAGYFQWDGSVEIVGKARTDDRVCLG